MDGKKRRKKSRQLGMEGRKIDRKKGRKVGS